MRQIKLALAALTLSALAGCGNFISDFGMPTVQISPAGSQQLFSTVGESRVLTGVEVKVEVQSLPGSPGGTIAALNLLGGGTLPGSAIRACPSTTRPDDCPKVVLTITFSAPNLPSPGTVVITGYQALPNNGLPARTVNLPSTLTLY